ncbi:phosphoribosylamine--glycine ligase [Pullulanibacillus sp. KACC 23026]|uniref:phosphoribosylamine--glycine ligase n=1 Tax=Pullulanibacillus sp. KACC 23026 TaxID=3028315 RepID=UPI0023B0A02D|nr:phosphoribosylamine--glycine ligase [Pullulanibacillus sp. KACC 23026]WEG12390.1 phosphoribosylamine--glycine ligase [Pullulanibacillus sp. KACC 23026]
MKVLVVGKGGREHALAWKLADAPSVTEVFVAPGNAGMSKVATLVPIEETHFSELIEWAQSHEMDLVVIGPEQPLVDGLADRLLEAGLKVFGPTQAAAAIEGSKAFSKDLMRRYNIPTAQYGVFTDEREALNYIREKGAPIVIKADGLAAGKGVTVALSLEEAEQAVHASLGEQTFGEAGASIVIEDYLEGEEFSLMAFVNGRTVMPLVIAQDHKRAFDGDKGPNTGGMGAYSPVPQISEAVVAEAVETILKPTANAMVQEDRPYVGVLYAGLMATSDGPKVIEFNCRFGDPETQVVLPRLQNDLAEVFLAVINGDRTELYWDDAAVCGVVLAAEGYPGSYQKGHPIGGFEKLDHETMVFHSGTELRENQWVTSGGRLLLVAQKAASLDQAIEKARTEMEKLTSPGTFFRRDIGYRALQNN